MAITSITGDWGTSRPRIVRIGSTDTLSDVASQNYIALQSNNIASVNGGVFEWVVGDLVAVAASDGSEIFRFEGDDFSTLIELPGGNGEVTLPVVDGDFTVFDGTLGSLRDAGYSASNATKTKVVMAGSAVQSGYIAHFVDTFGTIDDTPGPIINAGDIQAGLSGTPGKFISYGSTTAKGAFIFQGASNFVNVNCIITNEAMSQNTTFTVPDPSDTAATFLVAASGSPLVAGNIPKAVVDNGIIVDSGIAATNIQLKTDVKAQISANIGGSGAGPIDITVTGASSSSVVVATVQNSSNPCYVSKAIGGANKITVTFSADPGATAIINYIVYLTAQ